MSSKILILGGSGFIGSHLAARHIAEGDTVHIGVRPGWNGSSACHVEGVIAHQLDLRDSEQIESCFAAARPAIIYHLACRTGHGANGYHDPLSEDWLDDAGNLLRLLDAARRIQPALRSFVRVGSLAEYGSGPVPAREDQREMPETPYGLAQATATRLTDLYYPILPFRVFTARLGLTYGPGQSADYLVSSLIRHCIEGRPYRIEDPFACRDLIHVDDVVLGLMMLAKSALPRGIVNICRGEVVPNHRAAEIICEVTGASSDLVSFGEPAPVRRPSPIVWGSADRARTILGWSARLSFVEGARRTVRALTGGNYAWT